MKVELDYKQFQKFGFNMNEAEKNFNKFLETFMNKVGNMLIARVKKKTPVDTGLLRNSWEVKNVKVTRHYVYLSLINPVYYAFWVENGHKTVSGGWVQGRFMAKISMQEINDLMPALFEREFAKWLKGELKL